MKKSPQPPFCLLETMCWEQGVALLDRHLSRAESAAAALGFRFDDRRIREKLDQATVAFEEDAVYRLRMTIDVDGGVSITSGRLEHDAIAFRGAVVVSEPLDLTKENRGFKTTSREEYETAYKEAKDLGFDEAILLNDRGEVAEGTRTNVWIRRDGYWLTPPLESGCVAGVYRAHMLETWERAAEAVLRVEDLQVADDVGLSNAVHGFLPVPVTAGG